MSPNARTRLKNMLGAEGRSQYVEHMDTPDELRDYLGEMFGQIGERFDVVDQRFDGVDRRFDGVDRRFDGLERKVDQRFTEIEAVTNALVDTVVDINKKLNEAP